MIELSDNARMSLETYLQQVRVCLRGAKSVDAIEVEQNITEHIENELREAAQPVGAVELDAVLGRLGSPRQWVPQEELPWWRRFVLRLRMGPEDWRLAYLSFGLLVLGGIIVWALPLLVLASYLVSRAALSLSNNRIETNAQKWLLYPSLVVVSLCITAILLLLPWAALVPLALTFEHTLMERYRIGDDAHYWWLAWAAIVMLTGLWWMIQSVVLLIWPSLLRNLFQPLTGWFNRRWVTVELLVGLVLSAGGFATWIWLITTYL